MNLFRIALLFLFPLSLHAVEVLHPKFQGWEVKAEEAITLTAPDKQTFEISEPFETPRFNNTPVAPVEVRWTEHLCAIFNHQTRHTEIYLIDLKDRSLYQRVYPKVTFPAWYDSPENPLYSAHDQPKNWVENPGHPPVLVIETVLTYRNGGTKRSLFQLLKIERNKFQIIPKPSQ